MIGFGFPFTTVCFADNSETRVVDPIQELSEEIHCMKLIDPYLLSPEKTRMTMFETYTQNIVDQLADPEKGLGHAQTTEAFKDQISAIDAAEFYFKLIRNRYTSTCIDDILGRENRLIHTYDYDRKLYAKNLYRLMQQIDMQLRDLNGADISIELRRKISAIYPVLGAAMAKASLGDTRIAYEVGRKVTVMLSSMYSEFNRLSGSDTIFRNALMIEFLNERLISYGQYDF
jgi:hypothetical protein